MQADDDRQRERKYEDLVRQHANPGQQLDAHLQLARVEMRAVSPEEHDDIAHHQRRAECGEHHRQRMRAAPAQVAEHEVIDPPGDESSGRCGEKRGGDKLPAEGQRPRRRARPRECNEHQCKVRAPGQQL